MNQKTISFASTDSLLEILADKYRVEGMPGVVAWVNESFKTGVVVSMARDPGNLYRIEKASIYDRALIQLTDDGEETGVTILSPKHSDAFSTNLFLSVRLIFIDQPFGLLLYTTNKEC